MTSYSFITPDVVQGVTTSWLPVTTAYPSLSGCADAFFLYPGQAHPVGWDPGYGYFAGGALSCLPGPATTWWEQGHQNPDGYTSLSIQPITCPQAFTTAATELRDTSSTMVMCCPSGYDLQGGQPDRVVGACYSPLSSGQEITYTAQNDNAVWVQETLTVNTTSSISAIAMIGWNVAHTTATTSTSSALSSATSSASTSTPTSSDGLSAGAKAGIGVGVVLGVIALLCLVFLCFRRRQRHRHSQPTHFEQIPTPHEMQSVRDSTLPYKLPVLAEADAGLFRKDQPTHISARQLHRKPVELDTR